MSYIYGDRFGPEWALRHDGQKKRRPWGWRWRRSCAPWDRCAVGFARRAVGWRRGLAVLRPTRRAAPRCGFLVRARGPSAAWDADRWHQPRSGRCGHFCMNSRPPRPPRLDAREFLPVRSTVASFVGRLRLDSGRRRKAHDNDKDDCRKRRRATGRRGLSAVQVARRCGRRNPPARGRRGDRHRGRRPLRRAFQHREGLRTMPPPRRAAGRLGDRPRGASGVGRLRRSSGTGGGPISPLVRGGPRLTGTSKNFSFSNFPFSRVPTARLSKNFLGNFHNGSNRRKQDQIDSDPREAL